MAFFKKTSCHPAVAGSLAGGIINGAFNNWNKGSVLNGMAWGAGIGLVAGFVNWGAVAGVIGNVGNWVGGLFKENVSDYLFTIYPATFTNFL